jgi:hypothetical protein
VLRVKMERPSKGLIVVKEMSAAAPLFPNLSGV